MPDTTPPPAAIDVRGAMKPPELSAMQSRSSMVISLRYGSRVIVAHGCPGAVYITIGMPTDRAIVRRLAIAWLHRFVLPLPIRQLQRKGRYASGTATLFAALDVATGKVLGRCCKRHRHQEFLAFLRLIDRETPPELDIHLVLDDYATHKHPRVRAWLARRPRFHLHFTPTSASWINQVERWFGLISQRAIKRGSFDSVAQLVGTIERFIAQYNDGASPFAWVATAESVFGKLERLSAHICGTPQ